MQWKCYFYFVVFHPSCFSKNMVHLVCRLNRTGINAITRIWQVYCRSWSIHSTPVIGCVHHSSLPCFINIVLIWCPQIETTERDGAISSGKSIMYWLHDFIKCERQQCDLWIITWLIFVMGGGGGGSIKGLQVEKGEHGNPALGPMLQYLRCGPKGGPNPWNFLETCLWALSASTINFGNWPWTTKIFIFFLNSIHWYECLIIRGDFCFLRILYSFDCWQLMAYNETLLCGSDNLV